MIKMDALRQLYSDLGFEKVKTYIQSGNVIFQYKQTDDKKLSDKIEKEITRRFEFDYSNSKLTNSFFETKLKVTATTRNWKTTNELINIADKL